MEPVTVSLKELTQGVRDEVLDQAFGPDSLGIIVIKDLPKEFEKLRLEVLQLASILANLPEDELKRLESEESMWLTGWSCGKEILSQLGKPDYNKGSYYINCAFHKDPKLEGASAETKSKFENFKTYTTWNIWPDSKLTGLEEFEVKCKQLCNMIIDIAEEVANNCDGYIAKNVGVTNYPSGFLKRIVKNSTSTKARLLHYYPKNEELDGNDDDWCGTHVDHSCITGLTSALFLDESKGLTHNLSGSPDAEAGLYIRNRHDEIVKINIPSDCLAFQTGSALQEISRGKFKAVPHYVKGTKLSSIARNTLAVFCQPDLDEPVNDNENFAQFAERIVMGNH